MGVGRRLHIVGLEMQQMGGGGKRKVRKLLLLHASCAQVVQQRSQLHEVQQGAAAAGHNGEQAGKRWEARVARKRQLILVTHLPFKSPQLSPVILNCLPEVPPPHIKNDVFPSHADGAPPLSNQYHNNIHVSTSICIMCHP